MIITILFVIIILQYYNDPFPRGNRTYRYLLYTNDHQWVTLRSQLRCLDAQLILFSAKIYDDSLQLVPLLTAPLE